MSRYTVEPMTGVEIYRIGNEAIITLQPSTGYVSVSCPHHDELNGCHWWTARGGQSLHEFLAELECDYAMGKLFGSKNLTEFDDEATIADIKREVIRSRREGESTRDEAREFWDQLDGCDTEESVVNLPSFGGYCWYEWLKHRDCHFVAWFWGNVWAAFIAHLKAANPEGGAS